LKVANTEGQGANMRQRPSTNAPVLRTLAEGTIVEAIGGETNAEGRAWRNVRDPGGATGYIAAELLIPE
jgi:SH3-like domain-containing protein